jgi:hypothetical protein
VEVTLRFRLSRIDDGRPDRCRSSAKLHIQSGEHDNFVTKRYNPDTRKTIEVTTQRIVWYYTIQALMIVFSLLGPVPINNRIIQWTPQSLPANWKTQESRWDLYHWFRTCCLIAALALLAVSLGLR